MEEQKTQLGNRFLKGTQFGVMICGRFKICGSREALLDFNLLRDSVDGDNVQRFDSKWRRSSSLHDKFPMMILDNVLKSSSIIQRIWNVSWHGFLQDTVQDENPPVKVGWNKWFADV